MKKQSQSSKWIKIVVRLKLTTQDHKAVARKLVEAFEDGFSVKHLYYARYTDLESIRFEVSALTAADWNVVKRFFRQSKEVEKVEIIYRGTGSLAHAYAYQAVKRIPAFDKDTPDDNEMLDVLHWMCNMRGMDYIREARLYSYGALNIAHKTAIESEKNIEAMRKFNADARMASIAQELSSRLNLAAVKPVGPDAKPLRAEKKKGGRISYTKSYVKAHKK